MADGEGMVASGNQRGKSGVTSEQWKKIEALFEQALETPAAERPQLLQGIRDEQLRREVESLLHAHGQAGDFLDERERFFPSENGDSFLPGEIIERYRIIREIGRGGMGAVFLAERADEQYEKQVAIKLIKRGTDTDSVLRHFRNERQILAGFDHPNIARLFDGGTTESGLPYFVMEYVEGLPIDDHCKTHALSVAERLKLFREVCAAVSYAHRHLVIHRDIKRSNILITAEGVPKLLDFGIAKILQQGDETLATMTGLRPMTPEYASPEQVRGEPMTTASDVYSLGVVLYELLCGASPYRFPTTSPQDMARIVTEVEPRRPSTAVASNGNQPSAISNPKFLRGDIDNIVLMALRKEPERRYQSVEQFSDDIRRHLEQRPVLARKDTARYRAAKFVRRNRAGLAAAALVLLLLVVGIVATSWQAHIAMREKARAERRFNDVRKLANKVLFDYHEAIKLLPGATRVRELLVMDGLNYVDSLAAEAHDDASLQRELAVAYERVGDVRGGQGGGLGDVAGALESYAKAFRMREALLSANPKDAQIRADLATSHQKIAMLLLDTSETSKASGHLQKALRLFLDLAREQPASDELQLDVADTYNKLGQAMKSRGDLVGALEQYRAALAVCEQRAASNPADHRYRRALFNSHYLIAEILTRQGDFAGAIEINKKVLALGESLLADDPNSAEHRRSLVIAYKSGADYRSDGSDPVGALEYFRKALALEEELLATDPANARLRRSLGYMHKRIAQILAGLHDNPQALAHFNKALEINEKLAADAPADLRQQLSVAQCRAGLARVQAQLGEVDHALQECRKTTVLLGEIAEDPTNAHHRSLRAQSYEYLGYAFSALATSSKPTLSQTRQYLSAARDMFQQGLDILEDLRRRGQLDPANAKWVKEIADEIAKCDKALEEHAQAAPP